MVLQRVRAHPAAQRLRAARCGHHARADVDLSPVEGVRHQLQRGRGVRRDRRVEGPVRRKIAEPAG